MHIFLYFNLVYFFFIIYVEHYPKPSYIKYHKIIRALHGSLLVGFNTAKLPIALDLLIGQIFNQSQIHFIQTFE